MSLKRGDKVVWSKNPTGIIGEVSCRLTDGYWKDKGVLKPVTAPVIDVKLHSGAHMDFLESELRKVK